MKHIAYGFCAMLLAALLAGCEPSTNQLRSTAVAEYQVGHNKNAEKLFGQIIEQKPSDAESWYYLGRIAHAEGFLPRAIYCYQCCLDADPGYQPVDSADPGPRYWLKKAKKDAGDIVGGMDIIPKPIERPVP